MMNRNIKALAAALVEALEAEDDSTPVGYTLQDTVYTITYTVTESHSDLERANLSETLEIA